jgi:hypothetical protein
LYGDRSAQLAKEFTEKKKMIPLSNDHDNSMKIQLQIDIIYLIVFVTPLSAPHYAQVIRFLPLPLAINCA